MSSQAGVPCCSEDWTSDATAPTMLLALGLCRTSGVELEGVSTRSSKEVFRTVAARGWFAPLRTLVLVVDLRRPCVEPHGVSTRSSSGVFGGSRHGWCTPLPMPTLVVDSRRSCLEQKGRCHAVFLEGCPEWEWRGGGGLVPRVGTPALPTLVRHVDLRRSYVDLAQNCGIDPHVLLERHSTEVEGGRWVCPSSAAAGARRRLA